MSRRCGTQASRLRRRPRIYFEEWDDPMISGIGWVSEIIGIAGGIDIFADRARSELAKNRIVADPMEVVRRRPDLLLASWCGKKYQAEKVWARPGWDTLEPVKERTAFEIPAEIILQPGPGGADRRAGCRPRDRSKVGRGSRPQPGRWVSRRSPSVPVTR